MREYDRGVDEERGREVGGAEYSRVHRELMKRMADGTYGLNFGLPSQNDLADELGVSRDTVQRVMKSLVSEGWVESRRGSGTRVIQVPPLIPSLGGRSVSLNGLMNAAFEEPEVTLDVFTLTSESLAHQVHTQDERIRGGLYPHLRRISLRMLLPAEDLAELPYPSAKEANKSDDAALRERLLATTRRNTAWIQEKFLGLKTESLVKEVEFEIRHVRIMPTHKLYLVNGAAMLLAPYVLVQRPIHLRSHGQGVEAIDALGVGAAFAHFVKDDNPDSQGSGTVNAWKRWFDSWWDLRAL